MDVPFQDVPAGTSLEGPQHLHVTGVRGQDDNPRSAEFAMNAIDGFDAVESGIWRSISVTSGRWGSKLFNRLLPIRGFGHEFHIGLGVDQSGDAFTKKRMVIDRRIQIGIRMALMRPRASSKQLQYLGDTLRRDQQAGTLQLNFSARSGFAPQIQLCADSARAFTNPAQAPVPGCADLSQQFLSGRYPSRHRECASTISLLIVSNLPFRCAAHAHAGRRFESAHERFGRFVVKQRGQAMGFASRRCTPERWVSLVRRLRRSPVHSRMSPGRVGLLRGDSDRKSWLDAALGDGLFGPVDRTIERLYRFAGASRQHVAGGLKPEHQPVQALQQRVVSSRGDARSVRSAAPRKSRVEAVSSWRKRIR